MTRLYLIGGAVAALLAAFAWAYFAGRDAAKDAAEADNLKTTIENAEEFNDAADDDAGTGWYDRLFPGGSSD